MRRVCKRAEIWRVGEWVSGGGGRRRRRRAVLMRRSYPLLTPDGVGRTTDEQRCCLPRQRRRCPNAVPLEADDWLYDLTSAERVTWCRSPGVRLAAILGHRGMTSGISRKRVFWPITAGGVVRPVRLCLPHTPLSLRWEKHGGKSDVEDC